MEDKKTKIVNYHDLKNKFIYFICFGTMLAILTSVYYICFFREIHIDLTKNLEVSFVGEDGNGSIQVTRKDYNYNQRIEPFYKSLSESFSSNGSFVNGDEVEVTVNYDENLAEQFHIVVSDNSMHFTVEGLAQRYERKEDISDDYMNVLVGESNAYLKKDHDRILREDFSIDNNSSVLKETLIQKVFLKADNSQERDRIVFIYDLRAQGKSDNGEAKEEQIYYMVVFNDVNTNITLNDNQVYGEKVLSTQEDLTSEEGIIRYFKGKYVLSYEVEVL